MARKRGGGVPNPYVGGTSTATGVAPAVGQRGRGRPNRGGGGSPKKPQGGLYGGKAGEAATNQDPMAFFRTLLGNAGLIDYSNSARDLYAQDTMLNQMLGKYQDAQALKQRLSPKDWAKAQYGVGYLGKRGNQFDPGSLGNIQDRFETSFANTDPLSYITTEAMAAGLLGPNASPEFAQWFNEFEAPRLNLAYTQAHTAGQTPGVADWLRSNLDAAGAQGRFTSYRSERDPASFALEQARNRGTIAAGGNQQFADWYAQEYAPLMQQRWRQAQQAGNPGLTFDAFEAQQDPRQARRLFANRAPQYRQPSPSVPPGGRWSWWA